MELKSTRRIVTGHDAQGKAIVLFDSALPAKQRSAGGNGMTLLWVTSESPVDAAVLCPGAEGIARWHCRSSPALAEPHRTGALGGKRRGVDCGSRPTGHRR